jgi:hypothetical protein
MNGMKLALGLAVVVLMIGYASSSSSAQEVETQAVPGVSFAGLTTYDWVAVPRSPLDTNVNPRYADPRFETEALDPLIHDAVGRVLAARGFRRDADSPDFFVAYHVALNTSVDSTKLSDYVTWQTHVEGHLPGLSTASDYYRVYEQGSLILDFVSLDKQELLWRASVQAEINRENSQAEREARLDDVVEEMLKEFPPG